MSAGTELKRKGRWGARPRLGQAVMMARPLGPQWPQNQDGQAGYVLHLLFWRVRTTRFDRFPTYDCSWLPPLCSPSSRDRQKAIQSEERVSSRACTEYVCGE